MYEENDLSIDDLVDMEVEAGLENLISRIKEEGTTGNDALFFALIEAFSDYEPDGDEVALYKEFAAEIDHLL